MKLRRVVLAGVILGLCSVLSFGDAAAEAKTKKKSADEIANRGIMHAVSLPRPFRTHWSR